MMEDSDAALVTRAREGDQDAFRALVERHSQALFRLAYRMTGNEHDAEDMVQETFLRACRKLGRFESRSSFRTWLHRIDANCSLDLLRKRKRRAEEDPAVGLESGDAGPTITSPAPAPDQQLFHAEVQQRVEKLLQSSQPHKVKERVLFVLSQSGSDKASEMMASFARSKANPDLQLKSLEYLALFGGKESRQTLEEVYASSDNKKIKRSILGFFMIGGDKDRLLAAAKGEPDAGLRGEAIGQLGAMGARDELYRLYQAEPEVKLKKRILDALFVGGAADRMIDLAQHEQEPELRRAAIEKLGLMGSQKTAETLVRMYANENDKALRKKIIEALFLQGNAKAIVELYHKESDPELKKKCVEQLSLMNSKEGTELIEEILNK